MSTIHITANHTLGLASAKEQAEKLASELQDRFAVEYHWSGDTIEFARPGASGKIVAEESMVTVDVELGLMLAGFKGEVEKQLKSFLDQNLR